MLAHLDLTVLLTLNAIILTSSDKIDIQKIPLAPNEASYLESKDVLLQMLEKKLKEIKDHKKLKSANGEVLPKNVDFNLKSNGISAVGEAELLLRYGTNGQGLVNMTAEGISNVGRVQLLLGTGDNGLRIPGLSNLFSGSSARSGDKNFDNQLQLVSQNDVNFGFRRQTNISSDNNTVDKVNEAVETVNAVKDDKAKGKIEEKDKVEALNGTATDNTAVAAKGDYVPIITKASNASANVASSGPVVNSDLSLKSDTASVNGVANNGESVNKVK
ncbi:uncharacterized protein LOC133521891 isoform X2 [Cydia pomonella]|uniref:uncharacterized protein LOC133521891 isoform X2 n=1 Tax=Cydia pomonella TaxID=82600 RepID=UPI002ADD32E0|nr:uncharacterized protein LOC133521891 isoform X2 [Cydia pomonella]